MRHRSSERGFTLLESLVSLCIFSIASLGMVHSFAYQMWVNNQNETRSAAVEVAQEVMDGLRARDPALLPASGSTTQTMKVDHKVFRVDTTICGDAAACTAPTIRHVRVDVRSGGRTWYSASNVYAQLK